ncbi:MAG: hypothetical protein MMC23_003600 [Stictis urceolatum]|nr:hypothetical protein [Stictis urceolata]
MDSLKATLPQYLYTQRLVLELFDYSDNHYACLISSINSATAHAAMGDIGIRTPSQFDVMNRHARLSRDHCGNKRPDIDIYYIVRQGDKTGPMIGGVSLMQRLRSMPPDIGWVLKEEFHGKGYAIEAAGELLRLVRDDLGIVEVVAWLRVDNLKSHRVAEKIGLIKGDQVMGEEGDLSVAYVLPRGTDA